ncbi:MAG: hypothetical protein AAB275_02475 [Deltaproteobacteria bacterium]
MLLRIAVVDCQGGGIGVAIAKRLRDEFLEWVEELIKRVRELVK